MPCRKAPKEKVEEDEEDEGEVEVEVEKEEEGEGWQAGLLCALLTLSIRTRSR